MKNRFQGATEEVGRPIRKAPGVQERLTVEMKGASRLGLHDECGTKRICCALDVGDEEIDESVRF